MKPKKCWNCNVKEPKTIVSGASGIEYCSSCGAAQLGADRIIIEAIVDKLYREREPSQSAAESPLYGESIVEKFYLEREGLC